MGQQSLSMRYLPDINIWLALSIPAHTHHRVALEWFEKEPSSSLHFCRYTQQGTMRLMTTAAVTSLFGRPPHTNRAALQAMNELLEHDRIHFTNEADRIFEQWAAYADVHTASPKLWMDAYLAAFAVVGGFKLVTSDRAFKQFKGLNLQLL